MTSLASCLYECPAQQAPSILQCDNRSTIQIAHNDVFHKHTKHIENNCHFVRHHLMSNTLLLRSISTVEQPIDIFTKALSSSRFNQLISNLKLSLRESIHVFKSNYTPISCFPYLQVVYLTPFMILCKIYIIFHPHIL